jgi:diaminohydroxyphosphoribosylaminopyrimidine deaminase / 5-amino-6-(5-phosphoribosylamino)uracil reductase
LLLCALLNVCFKRLRVAVLHASVSECQNNAEVEKLHAAFGRALQAAQAFAGATAPNPPVGCVILDVAGHELAVAAHQKAGGLHAEALAIQKCRDAGVVAQIYSIIVTLEPCNHYGRTPPCVAAILTTPARQVWIGAQDPNPHVQGGGAAALRLAGLQVQFWPDAALVLQAQRLIAPFAKLKSTGVPWVTVKQALNVSGSMFPAVGQKTFTSQASLKLAHKLRKRADAILTGSGTVLADAPLFTVRHVPDFTGKRRKLIVMDRRKRVSQDYISEAAANGLDVVISLSASEALHILGEAGVMEVLVEAGPSLTESVLSSGLWDEHVLIQQAVPQDNITVTQNKEFKNVLRNH